MPNVSIALLMVVASLWAALNAVISGAKVINERRDIVLTGHDGKNFLSYDHRELILYNDWLPMTVGTGAICAAFGVFILYVPVFIEGVVGLTVFFVFCSLVPFLGAFSLLFGAVSEYQLMKQVLNAGKTTTVPPQQHSPS